MAGDWRVRSGPVGVLTGAGISTTSGIPDFRGPQGAWTQNPIAELSVFLAVGTSLRVHPAAGLCAIAVDAGADLVIVNNEPTPYDDYATEVIREPISVALPKIVAEPAAGSQRSR